VIADLSVGLSITPLSDCSFVFPTGNP